MITDSEGLLSRNDIVEVIQRYQRLDKKGSEHYGICPFHNDTHSSLQVSQRKQVFKCFACGAGGDAIAYLMMKGMSFHEATDAIEDPKNTEGKQYQAVSLPSTPSKKSVWKQIKPSSGAQHAISHPVNGIPSRFWTYYDTDGIPLGYVCRFDFPDGRKDVIPYVFATDGNRSEWRWLGFQKPRPLYNLHLLAKYPDAKVIMVEGEKCADAVQEQLDPTEYIATTWVGGADSSKNGENTDFQPLAGRDVLLWPDNHTKDVFPDKHEQAGQLKPWYLQNGNAAMLNIAGHIVGLGTKLSWLQIPNTLPHKWDAADQQWKKETFELLNFIHIHSVDGLPVVPEAPSVKPTPAPKNPTAPSNPPPPPIPTVLNDVEVWTKNPHYRFLGYDKDENSRLVYFFFSFSAKTVVKLSPSSITKANLIMLAPLNYWENAFPGSGKTKFDVDSATEFLMQNSHSIGAFKDKFIRGRGTWIDEGKIVIHTGDSLIVNKKIFGLAEVKSKYVYEMGERLSYGMSQPLNSLEASKIIEKAKWLLWEREINAYLLAGWCVIAPFCGVLQWRPHIWVTGPAGSGKSWVMDNFIKRLLGDIGVVVQGKTTEAGVRGVLQNDARAVLFDESDVDSNNDKERIQNILAMARSSSYYDGGSVVKGTQSGSSRSYTMRSCFAFSSIGVHVNQQSDRSRFTTLGLQSFEGKRPKEDFAPFEHEWNAIVTDEFVSGLQSRTIELLPTILKNARTFSDAVAAIIGQRRIGDQVGAMLAGAFSLTSHKEISYEDAVTWVSARDWTEERGLDLTKDENQLFGKLMGCMISIDTDHGRIERTIGELILVSLDMRMEFGLSNQSAHSRLRRMGILLKDGRILIANQSDSISNIIRDTPWSKNYNRILERLPGAEKVEPRTYFPGMKSRGVSIPMSMVTDALQEFSEDPKMNIPVSVATATATATESDDEFPF